MKAKKSKGKPAGTRASKDLAPRKSQDAKGGSFLSGIGKSVGGAVKTVAVSVLK